MNIKVKLSNSTNIKYYGTDEIEIDLEEYLLGCVPAEIGNAHIEACKAQAVASRTFALNAIKGKGYITDKSSIDQAFRTERFKGYPNAAQAVRDTAGEVLYYNGKLAKAYYSASNGGYMISSKTRWGGELPYSVSGADTYDDGKGNGHGVGMSQVGAKNRAKAGFGYRQILSFYYPTTDVVKIEEEKENIEIKIPMEDGLEELLKNCEVMIENDRQ